ncbi:MAG: hypothetical protein IE887_11160 [Campylobacterales bacterium]|nr:hypothetical protein [Campylobacterales bacterium]
MKSLKHLSTLGLSLVLSFGLNACGGGGGGDSSSGTPPTSTVTGQFIDAPVQGLSYSCSSGKSGVTNSNGEYTCNSGDDVTFSINGVVIGIVAAQATAITPYTLFPNNTAAAINLARLLQSLDDDSSDNIITIDTALEVNVPTGLNFTATDFEATVESALGTPLVSSQEAEVKMNEAIVAVGGTVPEPTLTEPIVNNGLATPPTPPTL